MRAIRTASAALLATAAVALSAPAAPADDGTGTGRDITSFGFSVTLPEGNYKVTLTLGSDTADSTITVRAESRRLMLENIHTPAGQSRTESFTVNVRRPQISTGGSVGLDPTEAGHLNWDDKLSLAFSGTNVAVRQIHIEKTTVPTLYVLGDSTVTDQAGPTGGSWAQSLTRWFDSGVAVANHAESGETMKSFLFDRRLTKVLSTLRPGDWCFLQFGHNDQKQQWPQTYVEAHTTYQAYLKVFIAEIRLRGATPVLVTSVQRRTFDEHGKIKNTHGDYLQAVREVAAEEKVALIDLAATKDGVRIKPGE